MAETTEWNTLDLRSQISRRVRERADLRERLIGQRLERGPAGAHQRQRYSLLEDGRIGPNCSNGIRVVDTSPTHPTKKTQKAGLA